jgi:hypothetical protein
MKLSIGLIINSFKSTQLVKDFLCVTCLLGLSVLLRLQRYPAEIGWYDDLPRDLLVAFHIIRFEEFPLLGHFATGIHYYHPPYYYYSIALLSFVSKSPLTVINMFVSYAATSAPVLYIIGRQLKMPRAGFFAGLIYAVSYSIVSLSRLWAAYAAIPTFLIGLCILIYGWKNRSINNIGAGYIICGFACTIHYSAVPLFIILPVLGLFLSRSTKHILYEYIFIVDLMLLLLAPVIFSANGGVPRAGAPEIGLVFNKSHLYTTIQAFGAYLNLFKPDGRKELTMLIVSVLVLLITMFSQYKKINKTFIVVTPLICFWIIFLSATKSGPVNNWFYNILTPILVFTLGGMIDASLHTRGALKMIVFTCILLLLCSLFYNKNIFIPKNEPDYLKVKTMVKYIYNVNNFHLQKSPPTIIGNNPLSNGLFDSMSYWFIQEFEFHERVATVKDGGLGGFELLNRDPDQVYLICRWYNETTNNCINDALKQYPGYIETNEIISPFPQYARIYLLSK